MKNNKLHVLLVLCFLSAGIRSQNTFPALGFAGINTLTPAYPFQVNGTLQANTQGWRQGIVMTNQTALYWDGSPFSNNDYFMGHSSSSPAGDFYQGYSTGIAPTATVNYASKVWVTNPPVYIPAASIQNFKNFLVQEDGAIRRVGVNVVDPARGVESFMAKEAQLRLTQDPGPAGGSPAQGVYTDFQTTDQGHHNIAPRNANSARNLGVDLPLLTANATSLAAQKIDVNGNARLRSVPSGTAEYLMLGSITPLPNGTGVNDIIFRKLAFSGSASQVLLGDGTWGAAPGGLGCVNNGLSVSGTGTSCIQLGQDCFAPGDPGRLLSNREIPMNKQNIYFTGQGIPTSFAIGLGYNPCVAMPAKFNTLQENSSPVGVSTIGGSFINRDQLSPGVAGTLTGVMGISDKPQAAGNIYNIGGEFLAANAPINLGVNANVIGNAGSFQSIAGQFLSQSANPGANIGILTRSTGGSANIGVIGSGTGGTNSSGIEANAGGATNTNYGVRSAASGGTDCFGVDANGIGAVNNNYGVRAVAGGGANSYAVYGQNSGAAPNHWAGYFQGDVQITGNLWNNLTLIFSDKRLKKDIKPLGSVTEKIKKLNGYTYNYKTEEFKERNFDAKNHIGLIAQEVKEVFPQLVSEDGKGFYAVDYQGMVPVLLEAIKEQQQQIEELKAIVKGSPDNSRSTNPKTIGAVNLQDAQVIVLEQNVPNPFAEQTTIAYRLNDAVQKAQILFYNADGKLINASELKAVGGEGQLNVFASDLSNGVYTYTLVVDGKVVETKRMIKTK